MNIKNITLKTAELGPVEWENVEKLQAGSDGYVLFISYDTEVRIDEEGNEYTILIGTCIPTDFKNKPTYKELINYIVQKEYPNGKEEQLLRHGIHDPEDVEYLEYYNNVEEISAEVKALLL